ncbi:hypothetical protein F503_07360 [Ophiostoma piceae UAMH 11346]|uniref:Uncharacterized protein n=1 Tax=Ophiostoma piceae (strain UAMH 11346) TaxID=1262450 RepID=S3C7T3_OPHP1|nr:hypothetical protein F503_07360 [Ophiostoma piceae UAMH 11346]
MARKGSARSKERRVASRRTDRDVDESKNAGEERRQDKKENVSKAKARSTVETEKGGTSDGERRRHEAPPGRASVVAAVVVAVFAVCTVEAGPVLAGSAVGACKLKLEMRQRGLAVAPISPTLDASVDDVSQVRRDLGVEKHHVRERRRTSWTSPLWPGKSILGFFVDSAVHMAFSQGGCRPRNTAAVLLESRHAI